MKGSLVIGTVLGIAITMAGGLFAGYQLIRGDDQLVYRGAGPKTVVAMPASVLCVPATSRDELGPVVGTLVGGSAGREVGDRDVATAAAAGAVGNRVDRAGRAC